MCAISIQKVYRGLVRRRAWKVLPIELKAANAHSNAAATMIAEN